MLTVKGAIALPVYGLSHFSLETPFPFKSGNHQKKNGQTQIRCQRTWGLHNIKYMNLYKTTNNNN